MPIITMPSSLKIRSSDWTFDRPAQSNRSVYTGARRVQADPWHALWTAKVAISTLSGEDSSVLDLRAFIAQCRGLINSFRVPLTEGIQSKMPLSTLAADVAQNALSLTLNGAQLRAGHIITLNDQPLIVTSVSGATVNFEPNLRAAATAGTKVEVANPTVLVAMSSSSISWTAGVNQVYTASFDVEEAY